MWDREIDGVHRTIAADPRTPIRVLAGPGTGKTFAMMRRIARLIEVDQCAPGSILAVTFTRTAARDLKEQLARLGVDGADSVRATTLHGLCFSILSKQEVFQLTGRAARPILDFEADVLVEDLACEFDGKRNVRKLIQAYEAAWARLQHEEPGLARSPADRTFDAALADWLRYHRSMLIGELVPMALTFLRQNPAIDVLPSFEHVLADEYQDLNKADQQLVEELARNGSLTVVGDDNQSIYRFRHANPEGIRTFGDTHANTIPYELLDSRRCPPNIARISNSLISRNINDARLNPLTPDDTKTSADIYVVQHRALDDEIQAVADFADRFLTRHPALSAGQALVLATRRFIGNRIRNALIAHGRNSLSYFLEDQLSSESAAEGYALLNLLVERHDRTAFRAWLGIGASDGRSGSYKRLRQLAEKTALDPQDVMASVAAGSERLPHGWALVERWNKLQVRLEQVRHLRGLDLVRVLWPREDEGCDDIRVIAENLAVEHGDPDELLDVLRDAITQPELPGAEGDIVRVMSLHKSKGLTAALVIVAGCVAGALPRIDRAQSQAEQDAQLQEQRRLFYVAITRASQTLVISSSQTMTRRDALAGGIDVVGRFFDGGTSMARTAASTFITELGPVAPRTLTTTEWRATAGF